VEQAVYVHGRVINLLTSTGTPAYILERYPEQSVVEQAVYVHGRIIGLLSNHRNTCTWPYSWFGIPFICLLTGMSVSIAETQKNVLQA
jgi:hypothetical protein